MANYKLSNKADKDLASIFEYSVFNFGHSQAVNYTKSLEAKLDLIASHEITGRKAD